jgi:hypothetical protein
MTDDNKLKKFVKRYLDKHVDYYDFLITGEFIVIHTVTEVDREQYNILYSDLRNYFNLFMSYHYDIDEYAFLCYQQTIAYEPTEEEKVEERHRDELRAKDLGFDYFGW